MTGARTAEEYQRYIVQDAALERRFQPVRVAEPTAEEAMEILRGVKSHYEGHHNVAIADEALLAAVRLSVHWLPERQLPDKALDLLDEACARARIPTKGSSRNWSGSVATPAAARRARSATKPSSRPWKSWPF